MKNWVGNSLTSLVFGAAVLTGNGLAQESQVTSEPIPQVESSLRSSKLILTDPSITYTDRILVTGLGMGPEQARKWKEEGKKDPFGNEFDYIFASNLIGCPPVNLFNFLGMRSGISFIKPKHTYKDVKKIHARDAWFHSEGCDIFPYWAEEGILAAEEVHFMVPIMGLPPSNGLTLESIFGRLRNAAITAGATEMHIYQNLWFPRANCKLCRPYHNPETGLKVFWHRYYPFGDSRNDQTFSLKGIRYTETYGVRTARHSTDSYFENIRDANNRSSRVYPAPTQK